MTSVVESQPSPEGFGGAGEPVRALRWEWPDDLRLIVATPFTGLATVEGTRGVVADDFAEGRCLQPAACAVAGPCAAER